MGDVRTDPAPPTIAAAPSEEPLKIEEIVTPEILESILKGYNRPELELVNFEAKKGTEAGDNYMSIMYALNIKLKNSRTGEIEELPVMLKTMPKSEFRKKMITDGNIFVKDVGMYDKVFPAMEEFQKEAGMPETEIVNPWPPCYACKTDGDSDYLAMLDLRSLGFKMANRKEGLDLEHCKVHLSKMAQFHAVSYAMFQGDFDKILEKYPWLAENMFKPDKMPEVFKDFTKNTFTQLASMIREGGEEKAASLVEKIYNDDYFNKMFELVGAKTRWAVITHGDCWTNNFLFLYDEETKKPIDVKFVDFQICRASSRAVDIHYFLYSSPKQEILNEKEEELEKHYFDEFTRFVTKLGVDVDAHELTWENFMKEIEKHRYYGAIGGFMLAMVTSADASDVPEMESVTEEDFGSSSDSAKNIFLNMMKDKALVKVKNIAKVHLPRCQEMKEYL